MYQFATLKQERKQFTISIEIYAMTSDILDELEYGVVLCQKNGTMLYANTQASVIFNCPSGNLTDYNILSFVDEYFRDRVKLLLETPEESIQSTGNNFIYIKLNGLSSKIFKLLFKKTKEDNILFMIYDYTTSKLEKDNMIKNISQMNDNITRNNLVLKTISNLCKNVFYKDRSMLDEILTDLTVTFHLRKSAICFKNGVRHVICCRKKKDGDYETERIDGDGNTPPHICQIWEREKDYVNCKELIFQIPSTITCNKVYFPNHDQTQCIVHVLKLKLNNDTVVGFLEFVEDDDFQLSNSDLEILESLSQILAYIINNKEQVQDMTDYIKKKFKSITGMIPSI